MLQDKRLYKGVAVNWAGAFGQNESKTRCSRSFFIHSRNKVAGQQRILGGDISRV